MNDVIGYQWPEGIESESHRLAKRHPLDCGRTKCFWCHSEKLTKEKPYRYKRKYGM